MKVKNKYNYAIYIIAISLFIISILGGTISYYLINKSLNSVNATSAYIKLNYTDGKVINASQLIPGDFKEIEAAYMRSDDKQCLDIDDSVVCSVYGFSIENIGDKANFVMYLHPNINEISNLYYLLYRIDNEGNATLVYSSDTNITNGEISLLGYTDNNANTISLSKDDGIVNYEVVLYIKNEDRFQSEDMGKKFQGNIVIRLVNYDGRVIVEDR